MRLTSDMSVCLGMDDVDKKLESDIARQKSALSKRAAAIAERQRKCQILLPETLKQAYRAAVPDITTNTAAKAESATPKSRTASKRRRTTESNSAPVIIENVVDEGTIMAVESRINAVQTSSAALSSAVDTELTAFSRLAQFVSARAGSADVDAAVNNAIAAAPKSKRSMATKASPRSKR